MISEIIMDTIYLFNIKAINITLSLPQISSSFWNPDIHEQIPELHSANSSTHMSVPLHVSPNWMCGTRK